MFNYAVLRPNFTRKLSLAIAGMAALVIPVVVGVMNAPSARAQAAAPASPKFEVASIKPCKADVAPGGRGGGVAGPIPGRLTLNCVPVIGLIRQSYVLFANGRLDPVGKLEAIEGSPAWINSDRYTIEAKAEGTPNQGTMLGPMMRALLEERFKLKIHRETRQVPVYALTVGKGGPKLRVSQEGSCVPADIDHPWSPPAPGQPLPQICKMAMVRNNGLDDRGATMADFCLALSNRLDRKVVDKTGIAGIFDFHLEFAPDPAAGGLVPGSGDLSGSQLAAPPDPAGASIFTAIQQQLGLKLEPAKGPGEFLVIDHVEKPSEN